MDSSRDLDVSRQEPKRFYVEIDGSIDAKKGPYVFPLMSFWM